MEPGAVTNRGIPFQVIGIANKKFEEQKIYAQALSYVLFYIEGIGVGNNI